MSNLYLNIPQLQRWVEDNGDYTHSLNYSLDETSTVVDLGGFTGVWANEIIKRYNCNVYLVEPIAEAYKILLDKFKSNSKVHILKVGVGVENTEKLIYVNGDSTSFNIEVGEAVKVEIKTLDTILDQWNIEKVDLLQVNIEGDEYELLQYMIGTGIIDKFKNLQVQFHLGIEDAVEKYNSICEGLEQRGFKVKYSYPFVWEAWTKE
jgi:FkbM family methyltransferase